MLTGAVGYGLKLHVASGLLGSSHSPGKAVPSDIPLAYGSCKDPSSQTWILKFHALAQNPFFYTKKEIRFSEQPVHLMTLYGSWAKLDDPYVVSEAEKAKGRVGCTINQNSGAVGD